MSICRGKERTLSLSLSVCFRTCLGDWSLGYCLSTGHSGDTAHLIPEPCCSQDPLKQPGSISQVGLLQEVIQGLQKQAAIRCHLIFPKRRGFQTVFQETLDFLTRPALNSVDALSSMDKRLQLLAIKMFYTSIQPHGSSKLTENNCYKLKNINLYLFTVYNIYNLI